MRFGPGAPSIPHDHNPFSSGSVRRGFIPFRVQPPLALDASRASRRSPDNNWYFGTCLC